MASGGAMVDCDAVDEVLSGDNPFYQVSPTTLSSPSFFACSSTFPSDATPNSVMPADTNTSLLQPIIPIALSEGEAVEFDNLPEEPFSYENAWLDASDYPGLFASSSNFLAQTNTALATDASSSADFFAPPSNFLADAETTTALATDASSSPRLIVSPSIFLGDLVPTTTLATGAPSSPSLLASPYILLADPETTTGLWTDASDYPGLFASSSNFLAETNTALATDASSSAGFFAPPSNFLAETNTALATDAPNSPGLFASPSNFLADAETTTALATDASSSPHLIVSPSIFLGDLVTTTALATDAASSHSLFASPSNFLADVKTTKVLVIDPQRDFNMIAKLCMPLVTGAPTSRLGRSSKRSMWFIEELVRFMVNARSHSSTARLPSVCIGKLPEWAMNLDSQYLTTYEISRVLNHAKNFEKPGALGILVFEKGNYSCLGDLKLGIIQELDFTSGLDSICSSLQALDLLTTTHVSTIARTKFSTLSYEKTIWEILQVLRLACVTHKLPLAQTWANCGQQGKRCSHHSDKNCRSCISTIDVACYVNDNRMHFFHEACSKHQLLPGQGVAGKAFATNQPCFLPDIGSSSELEYPLSHHAKIFGFKGAVAVRLRCRHTGMADFVLEFFLPTACGAFEEQKAMMESLWSTVRGIFRTLRHVTDEEVDEDAVRKINELNSLSLQKAKKRKPMARRSPVWTNFTEVMVGDTVKAECNHCGLHLCCGSKNGTSSLASHFKRCKLNPSRITGPI